MMTPPNTTRAPVLWTVDDFALTSVAETLLSLNESRDGAATAPVTSRALTSGRRLAITGVQLAAEAGGITPALSRLKFYLRHAAASPVVAGTSPIQAVFKLPALPAVAKNIVSQFFWLPDGFEYVGDGLRCLGLSVICPEWGSGTNVPLVSASIFGFEYNT